MSKSHQCQEVLVILLLMFTIWETILHKHNYLPLDLSVLPLFQVLILEPVRTGTQTFLSMQPYLYPFQSYTPMAGVDKESSEDAAFYLAVIQADRQVWPVSHLKHVKFSVVNTIMCVCTHTRAVHLYIYTSLHQFIITYLHECIPQHSLWEPAGFFTRYSMKPLGCDTVPPSSFQFM